MKHSAGADLYAYIALRRVAGDGTAMARAALTGTGTARYGQLQQTTLQVAAPQSGITYRRAGTDDPYQYRGTALPH